MTDDLKIFEGNIQNKLKNSWKNKLHFCKFETFSELEKKNFLVDTETVNPDVVGTFKETKISEKNYGLLCIKFAQNTRLQSADILNENA